MALYESHEVDRTKEKRKGETEGVVIMAFESVYCCLSGWCDGRILQPFRHALSDPAFSSIHIECSKDPDLSPEKLRWT